MHNHSQDEMVENESTTTKESTSDAKLSTKSKAELAVMSLFGILFVASQMESTKLKKSNLKPSNWLGVLAYDLHTVL